MADGEGSEDLGDRVYLGQHHRVAVLDLEGGARVHDVLAGGAPVHPAGAGRTEHAPQRIDERHHGVPARVEVPLHGGQVEQLDPRPARDLARRRSGHDVEVGLHRREGGLHVQPALDHGPILPDRAHGRRAVAVLEVEGVEGGGRHYVDAPRGGASRGVAADAPEIPSPITNTAAAPMRVYHRKWTGLRHTSQPTTASPASPPQNAPHAVAPGVSTARAKMPRMGPYTYDPKRLTVSIADPKRPAWRATRHANTPHAAVRIRETRRSWASPPPG